MSGSVYAETAWLLGLGGEAPALWRQVCVQTPEEVLAAGSADLTFVSFESGHQPARQTARSREGVKDIITKP